jgi:hypothetical protein
MSDPDSQVKLEPWGALRVERTFEKFRAASVEITWQIDEHSARDPKTRARIERARSRGYNVRIIPGPPDHRLLFFGAVPEAKQEEEEDR